MSMWIVNYRYRKQENNSRNISGPHLIAVNQRKKLWAGFLGSVN